MMIQFPVPPPGPIGQFLQQCFDVMRRALLPVLTKDEATARILLSDVNSQIWKVSITTTGVVTTTTISGKTREI